MADDPNTATIIERLVARGWQRTASSKALDWANLVYDGPRGQLQIDYMPAERSLDLQSYRDDGDHELLIEFGDQLGTLLDLIVEEQDNLTPESWQTFVDRLVETFPRVSAVLGEEDDDIVPLTADES